MKNSSFGSRFQLLMKSCISSSSHERSASTSSSKVKISRKRSLSETKSCFYPNYKITANDKIDISFSKPKFCCRNRIHLRNYDVLKKKEILEKMQKASECVFQIIILVYNTLNSSIRVKLATGFYITLEKKTYAISVFHLLDDYDREFEEIKIFGNSSSSDLNFHVTKALTKKKFSANNYFEFKEICKQLKRKHELSSLKINFQSLLKRKRWVESMYFDSNLTLDPIYSLQPMPTLDVVILEYSSNKRKIGSLQVSKSPISINEHVFHIGYNNTKGEINRNSDEYKFFNFEKCIPLTDILHDGKSISVGKILALNEGIIEFESSSIEGSSGSPLLNANGEVVGITFGNFNDHETLGENKIKGDIFSFDRINLKEKISNLNCFKNANLSTNINHPGIKSMINRKTLPEINTQSKKKY